MIVTEKGFIGAISATEEDLKLINKFTRRELTADQVYTFSVVLCDNDIDRDFEQFTPETLKAFEELFVGKTGIFDHSMKGRDQVARTYYCKLEETAELNSIGEPYLRLVAKAYMPRTPKTQELIQRLEAGILKEVSVSCSVAKEICSVCGANRKEQYCDHKKGRFYGNGMKKLQCHTKLEFPTDAYEWSFVAVPAQRRAGVIKSYKKEGVKGFMTKEILKKFDGGEVTLTCEEAAAIQKEFQKMSEICEGYLGSLRSKAVKGCREILPTLEGEMLSSIIDGMSATQLKAFCGAIEKGKIEKPQLKFSKSEKSENNNEFVI